MKLSTSDARPRDLQPEGLNPAPSPQPPFPLPPKQKRKIPTCGSGICGLTLGLGTSGILLGYPGGWALSSLGDTLGAGHTFPPRILGSLQILTLGLGTPGIPCACTLGWDTGDGRGVHRGEEKSLVRGWGEVSNSNILWGAPRLEASGNAWVLPHSQGHKLRPRRAHEHHQVTWRTVR